VLAGRRLEPLRSFDEVWFVVCCVLRLPRDRSVARWLKRFPNPHPFFT
jgi:hypothetical protein